MPRRNIGRPRPRFMGFTQRFSGPVAETRGTVAFLKVANNGTPWEVPADVHLLKHVWGLGAGASGAAGGKGGAGAGGDGGCLARVDNYPVYPGQLINFLVDVPGGIGTWFAGTVDKTDAVLFTDIFGGIAAVGDYTEQSPGHVTSTGGSAAGVAPTSPFPIVPWVQTSNSEVAQPGGTQSVEGAAGNPYGGGGAGGTTGGGAGGTGADGILVIEYGTLGDEYITHGDFAIDADPAWTYINAATTSGGQLTLDGTSLSARAQQSPAQPITAGDYVYEVHFASNSDALGGVTLNFGNAVLDLWPDPAETPGALVVVGKATVNGITQTVRLTSASNVSVIDSLSVRKVV